jgi:hypothetical protein
MPKFNFTANGCNITVDATDQAAATAALIALGGTETKNFRSEDNVAALPTAELWQVIAKLDWAKDLNYERIQNEIADLDPNVQRKLHASAREQVRKLDRAVRKIKLTEHQQELLESQDYVDTLWHIFGLGEIFYQAALMMPKRVFNHLNVKYATVNGYRESFAYAFQFIDFPSET